MNTRLDRPRTTPRLCAGSRFRARSFVASAGRDDFAHRWNLERARRSAPEQRSAARGREHEYEDTRAGALQPRPEGPHWSSTELDMAIVSRAPASSHAPGTMNSRTAHAQRPSPSSSPCQLRYHRISHSDMKALRQYVLSLPERVLRSASALAGGWCERSAVSYCRRASVGLSCTRSWWKPRCASD